MGKEHVKFGVDIEHIEAFSAISLLHEEMLLELLEETKLDKNELQRFFLDQKKEAKLPLTEEEQKLDTENTSTYPEDLKEYMQSVEAACKNYIKKEGIVFKRENNDIKENPQSDLEKIIYDDDTFAKEEGENDKEDAKLEDVVEQKSEQVLNNAQENKEAQEKEEVKQENKAVEVKNGAEQKNEVSEVKVKAEQENEVDNKEKVEPTNETEKEAKVGQEEKDKEVKVEQEEKDKEAKVGQEEKDKEVNKSESKDKAEAKEKAEDNKEKEIEDKSKASNTLSVKEEKDMAAYEKSLNQETNTMQVIRNSHVRSGNSKISEREQAALLAEHELHNQNEQVLRSHFKDVAEEKEINIPELIKNQVRLEAGELSPTERMEHYRQIVRMKDADGDQYSRKLAEYRTKVAESAGKEFDEEHKDHTKLSFLNKTANAIEKIMCAMTKNPLGLVVLLVAAVNAPLMMIGLLGFMAWKRKHPDMGYQKALQAQQQREIQDMRQKLADFHGVDIKDIPESEAKKVLREEYVRNKTNEAVLEKLEKESKKQVDKAADAYAKDIKKQGHGKFSGKEIKEHFRRDLAKDPVFKLESNRDKNLKIAMQSVKPKSSKGKTL